MEYHLHNFQQVELEILVKWKLSQGLKEQSQVVICIFQMRSKEVEVLTEFNKRTGYNSVPITPETLQLYRYVTNKTGNFTVQMTKGGTL